MPKRTEAEFVRALKAAWFYDYSHQVSVAPVLALLEQSKLPQNLTQAMINMGKGMGMAMALAWAYPEHVPEGQRFMLGNFDEFMDACWDRLREHGKGLDDVILPMNMVRAEEGNPYSRVLEKMREAHNEDHDPETCPGCKAVREFMEKENNKLPDLAAQESAERFREELMVEAHRLAKKHNFDLAAVDNPDGTDLFIGRGIKKGDLPKSR